MGRRSDINWEKIKQVYIATDTPVTVIAKKHGISLRSLQLKVKEQGWAEAKQELKDNYKPEPKIVYFDEPFDSLETVDHAIKAMKDQLATADTRGAPAAAMALVKLMQYRDQVAPPTVEKLVARAIDLGIKPDTFMAELRKQWSLVSTNSN